MLVDNGFYLQGMAGNIIHAIATTNAIVGGLIVIEALKLLAGKPQESKVRHPLHQLPGVNTPELSGTNEPSGLCTNSRLQSTMRSAEWQNHACSMHASSCSCQQLSFDVRCRALKGALRSWGKRG